MQELLVAALTFVVLVGVGLASLLLYRRLPERHREDDTNATVRLVANLFVVMTSLVLGLMISSVSNTYQSIDRNIHTYATELVLLDRALRTLGPEADEARRTLTAYVEHSLTDVPVIKANRESERLLAELGHKLRSMRFADDQKIALWNEIRQIYREAVHQRWILVGQSEGPLPLAIVCMLVAWLVLIFAGFGYRAPRNHVVVASFVAAALLVSVSVYLILDMNSPFSGPIQLSDAPLRRALAEIKQ
jgi:hypothetical protein